MHGQRDQNQLRIFAKKVALLLLLLLLYYIREIAILLLVGRRPGRGHRPGGRAHAGSHAPSLS